MTQNYKVGDKVRILDASKIISGAYRGLKDGGIYEVVELYKGREYDPIVKLDDGHKFGFMDDYYNYIEKVAEDVTKFKIGDKVRILKTGAIMALIAEEGSILEVVNVDVDDGTPFLLDIDGESCCTLTSELQYIELVSDKPTKKQRLINAERSISVLESEVAELKAKVEALEKAQKPTINIQGGVFKTPSDADVAEIASKLAKAIEGNRPKSTNEQRKAIIAEAKAFVGEHTKPNTCDGGWNADGAIIYNRFGVIPNFHVNTEKRTVALILNGASSGTVRGKFFAKCALDDVFNADIGKAIALGRALGLDVSKFEQAVKPTVAVGQRIQSLFAGENYGDSRFANTKVTGIYLGKYPKHDNGWHASEYRILDDTEAKY